MDSKPIAFSASVCHRRTQHQGARVTGDPAYRPTQNDEDERAWRNRTTV